MYIDIKAADIKIISIKTIGVNSYKSIYIICKTWYNKYIGFKKASDKNGY